MESDRDLVRRVVAGDPCAFEALFKRYGEKVRRRLMGMTRSAHTADDLTQETFLRLWTRAEQWSGTGPFGAWLLRVATNLALNHLRSVRRHPRTPLMAPSTPQDDESEQLLPGWMIDASTMGPDAVAEQLERRGLLRRLVDQLPEEKRDVVRLVYDAQMEIREVSDTLGIPPGTVKSRLHDARRKLAREWEKLNGQ